MKSYMKHIPLKFAFIITKLIIFVSDETLAKMPRNHTMNQKHRQILRKWSKFQAKAQKSSKNRLYLRDLLIFSGEQEISAISGRAGIYICVTD